MQIRASSANRTILIISLSLSALILILLWVLLHLRTRRARLLVETNTTKDKFFSIISHDLKNPAIAQRDGLQHLADNAGKWDAAYISGYCRKLLKSANENVELIYTLLGWSQTQTGRMTYQPTTLNLVDTLKTGVGVVQSMANEKEIQLHVQMPASALITGDDNMLNTVVRNLLVNAVKFTARGGTVTLAVEPAATGGKYTVSVSDTGIGMTTEQINNLYRLATQPSRTGTAGEQGSGLGLIVCRELLEKHGATLHIESTEGTGSRFWFEI